MFTSYSLKIVNIFYMEKGITVVNGIKVANQLTDFSDWKSILDYSDGPVQLQVS